MKGPEEGEDRGALVGAGELSVEATQHGRPFVNWWSGCAS